MLRTPTAAKAVAFVASGILHAAAFAAAAPRSVPYRGKEVDLEIPFVVESAEQSPAQSPAPALSQTPPELTSAPPPPSPRAQHTRLASAPHALASEPQASASGEVASTENPPAVGRSSDDAVPHFVMLLGGAASARGGGGASGDNGGSVSGVDPIFPLEEVTTPARLVAAAPPHYPLQGRANGVEADVTLEIVVDSAGRVQSTRVLGARRREFDEAALDAVSNYRFAPATFKGRSVPVRMKWTVEFRLN